MYRAVYKFDGSDLGALSFDVGDRFTAIDDIDGGPKSDWLHVYSAKGQIGYVPSNYLQPDEIDVLEVLKSIDRAIDAVKQQAKVLPEKSKVEQLKNLGKLETHRKQFLEQHQLRQTLCPPRDELSSARNDDSAKDVNIQELKVRRHAPVPPCSLEVSQMLPAKSQAEAVDKDSEVCAASSVEVRNTTAMRLQSTNKLNSECEVKNCTEQKLCKNERFLQEFCRKKELEANVDGLGNELVEQVRRSTLLSFEKSKVAVNTMLSMLSNRIPEFKGVIDKIMEDVTYNQTQSLEESSDAFRLNCILKELVAAKDDSQQRSWFLHEDEGKICNHLEEMNSIIDGANPETSRKVLEQDGYDAVQNLAQYYQMETRRSIRLLLLQSFGSMCALDPRIVSELLNSVLPLELARDIQDDLKDVQKLTYSALVLSMTFSTGEALPLQYYAHLNSGFINFLLEHIEVTDQDVESERIVDGFIRLILSFNLHFELPEENIVMKVFAERKTAKTFTEKLLLMLNREDDPVKLFEHAHNCPNSVLKFVSDLYSCPETSNLFYTNDAKVLVDIIVRQLTDLSSGDKMRIEYLSLMHLLLKNSQYLEHKHRQTELQQCFQRISQDDKEAELDKRIVLQIWKEFPNEFYNCL